jgi:tetratricopeptide (TPR) repeat protein
MRIRLESRAAKLLATLATLALLIPYCEVAGMRYLAARVAQKPDRASLERAVAIEPGNAEYRERLGRYLLFTDQNAAAALRHYQIGAALNPYSATSWLGIAQSELILGNEASSLDAIDQALDVDPTTPAVAWDAASLFVATGHTESALRELRFVLANDPGSLFQGLQLVRRLEPSAAKAAQTVLPDDPAVHFTFINMLLQSGHLEDAKQVWPVTLRLHQPIDPKLAFYLFNTLLQSGDSQTALKYWGELSKVSPEVGRLQQSGNLIHNPSFEYDTLNGGFDWLYLPSTEVNLEAETSDSHDGRRCLSVTFLGQRTSDIGIHQYVLLEPSTRYSFHGYMKSNLQTAQGPRFILVDLKNNNHLFESEESISDRQWKKFTATFVTAPNTDLAILLVGRSATSLISGKMLIDDLRLEKVGQ